ncbi:MAG: hypothetical protein WA947_14165 [Phormidesmis sp.]
MPKRVDGLAKVDVCIKGRSPEFVRLPRDNVVVADFTLNAGRKTPLFISGSAQNETAANTGV